MATSLSRPSRGERKAWFSFAARRLWRRAQPGALCGCPVPPGGPRAPLRAGMAGLPIYQTTILPDWIDYNGHLRDAYYALIVSQASDALMDRVGLDAPYRTRTRCTLYTVEMH